MQYENQADNAKIAQFRIIILRFWNKNGRKSLPWRLTRDPWKILLAEILLRKTTSHQAEGIYEKLAELSPEQMARMSESDLETLLRPLGMYRVRAQQLRSIAKAVDQAEPRALQMPGFLEKLPGVGRYIRNAVLCFAFNQPKPALDTNMIRVILRVFGVESKRSRPREDSDLWLFAEQLVPENNCREFNWGVLDFAAAVCKPRNPNCSGCPLRKICHFCNKKGDGNELKEI